MKGAPSAAVRSGAPTAVGRRQCVRLGVLFPVVGLKPAPYKLTKIASLAPLDSLGENPKAQSRRLRPQRVSKSLKEDFFSSRARVARERFFGDDIP
jgi:hypothetical protein